MAGVRSASGPRSSRPSGGTPCPLGPSDAPLRDRGTTPNHRVAFTLVELLIVIAILGILMSLVTAGAQSARRRGAVTKAKAMIASLETAIASYEADMGAYPPSGTAELVAALQDDPQDVHWGGPYMEFKEEELEGGELLDPWGHPYVYVSVTGGSPEHREQSYDLYSFGPNGEDDSGAGDDIYNW